MALRRAPGVFSRLYGSGASRPRRVLAAFGLGAAIAAAGMAVDLASAHGPFTAQTPILTSGAFGIYSVIRTQLRGADEEAPRKRHRERITLVRAATPAPRHYAGGEPVCVRLCDGYFFPLASAGGDSSAACNSLCPDAPTEVYYRGASDRIEDSVSASGRRYSALPVALRYRGIADNTCSCHRGVVAYAPLRDATLRRGDAIMTPAGMMVFHGAEGGAHAPRDFTALSAAGLPQPQRAALQEMERVSVETARPSLKQWLASQTAPALASSRPVQVLARARGDDRIRLVTWPGAQD